MEAKRGMKCGYIRGVRQDYGLKGLGFMSAWLRLKGLGFMSAWLRLYNTGGKNEESALEIIPMRCAISRSLFLARGIKSV